MDSGLRIRTLGKGGRVLLCISLPVDTGSLQACGENWTPIWTYAGLCIDVIVFEDCVHTNIVDPFVDMMVPDPLYQCENWTPICTYACLCIDVIVCLRTVCIQI